MAPIQAATFFASDILSWIGTLVSSILGFIVATLLTSLILYGTISLFDASEEGAEDRVGLALGGSFMHTFACGLAGINIATFSDTHWALLVLKCLSVGLGTFGECSIDTALATNIGYLLTHRRVSGNAGLVDHTAPPGEKAPFTVKQIESMCGHNGTVSTARPLERQITLGYHGDKWDAAETEPSSAAYHSAISTKNVIVGAHYRRDFQISLSILRLRVFMVLKWPIVPHLHLLPPHHLQQHP